MKEIFIMEAEEQGERSRKSVIEGDDLQNTNKNGIKKIINSWINERVTQ